MTKVIIVPPMDFYENTKPLGVLSLATILKDSFDVEILNYHQMLRKGIINKDLQDYMDLMNLANYLCSLHPAVIGFSSTCADFHFHIYLAKIVKDIDNRIKIVFGGLQATIVAEEALKEYSWIDAIGLGECETNIVGIINGLLVNDLSTVKGVAYRNSSGEIKKTSEYLLTENLEDMQYIDYDLLSVDNTEYINIETGRGCPFKCKFCFSSTIHKHHYRKKSNNRLIEEIKRNIEKYNYRRYSFIHDLFTYDKKSILEFCKMLKENDLDIKWKTSARIDTIDEELVIEMLNSGLESLFFGIESGSSKIQKEINKNLQIDRIFSTIEMLKRTGMKDPAFSFIYGFETEDDQDIVATLDVIAHIIKAGFHSFRIYQLKAFNGTEIYKTMFAKLSEQSMNLLLQYNYYTECTKEIYINKKSLFPYTYKVDTEIIKRYPYLDVFINRVVASLVKYLNKASKELFSTGEHILELYKMYEEYMRQNEYSDLELNTEIVFGYTNFVAEKVQNKVFLPLYLCEKNIQLIKRGVSSEATFKTNVDILPIIMGEEVDAEHLTLDNEVEVVIRKNNNKLEIFYR